MGLAVYNDTVPGAKLSQDGAFTNALRNSLDGRGGGSSETLLYIRNDDAAFYYTGISIQPVDINGGVSILDGTSGYYWKLIATSSQPTLADWNLVTGGSFISLANLGAFGSPDTSTYLPVWVRIEIPKNAPIKTYTDIALNITATQLTVV